ncbi:MAG: LTA synthase family protein [Prevotella sp.]|nr:LTA synthase family protein [Prevotella sp.]
MKIKSRIAASPLAIVWNILLLYVAYSVTRMAFFFENHSLYTHLAGNDKAWDIALGGWLFDTSAIAYTNALYILLILLPCHTKENALWQRCCKWLYMVVNGLALAMNLCDTVYFRFTARRTTIAFFSEFGSDDKIGSIVAYEFIQHWYLVLLFAAIMLFLHYCYVKPAFATVPRKRYYTTLTLALLVAAYCCWAGMRGGLWDNRPIKISTANQYIIRPNDASLILNTPFSMIRTVGKHTYHNPGYYQSREQLEHIYTPIHQPLHSDTARQRKNVVVIFLESFGREYFGSLNQEILPGYKGYTPFLDSLMQHAVTFRYTYANGRASIDAMPSGLSGLPMFVESFVAASHANNQLSGMAACLDSLGYETAFFHGAPASSLGFQGFCKSTGFQHCWSQEDFESDSRTEGTAAYDNWWGIWDEPFLQYFRMKMSDMKEPFMTALFTLTSHHPFHVPEQYKDTFPEEELPIHKCIRYTDHALRRFFSEAAKEPWFKNTVFVMTGDHTNLKNHAEYESSINQFSTSIILYDPHGNLEPGIRDGIAQQTDILPTILNYVGYDKPYMAFGCDMLNTPVEDLWAVNYQDGIYQYCKGNYVIQFDGEKTIGVYRLTDHLMQHNLLNQKPAPAIQMERELKAIIQQYMERMIDNRLLPES